MSTNKKVSCELATGDMKMGEKVEEHDERQYLELIRNIIENGNVKGDRTGK